jgi:pre-mRNA-splicing factor ATP-dependent RNA helicase DHX38/PRP16
MKQKFWELAGSKLGNILGIEKKAEDGDVDGTKLSEDGSVDYKNESQYSTHLQKKSEAVRCTCDVHAVGCCFFDFVLINV